MKKNQLLTMALGAIVLLGSCTKDPETAKPEVPSEELFKSGVYFVNEGGFGASNASIDLFNRDSNKVYENIFEAVNGRPLGDVAQSMYIKNGKGYIVLNGSGKIEVINITNAQSIATITGFSSPRYMVFKDTSTAYVSDWSSNTVKEINLVTNTIVRSISVGEGPEGLLIANNKLYVTNSGGYGIDSTISVIDLSTKLETKKFVVGDAPTAIFEDANAKLWVLCRGSYGVDFMTSDDDTEGKLVEFNSSQEDILKSIKIGNKGDHPDKIKMNESKNTFYFLSSYNFLSGVYKFNITDVAAPSSPFIEGYYYGIGYDKVNDEIYLADALDFKQRGLMKRYSSTGVLINTYTTGIIPNGISEQ